MLRRLKEILFALLLSPAIYYGGFWGAVFFATIFGLHVLSHVARDIAAADELMSGEDV